MDIRSYLKKHGLSQEEFGDLIGVTQSFISQLLKGDAGLSIERVKQIAKVTKGEITPHDLMPETFPPGFKFPKNGAAKGDERGGNKRVAA